MNSLSGFSGPVLHSVASRIVEQNEQGQYCNFAYKIITFNDFVIIQFDLLSLQMF